MRHVAEALSVGAPEHRLTMLHDLSALSITDAVPLLEEITGAGDILARERAQQLLNLFEAA